MLGLLAEDDEFALSDRFKPALWWPEHVSGEVNGGQCRVNEVRTRDLRLPPAYVPQPSVQRSEPMMHQ
jgi:hypothetical protein